MTQDHPNQHPQNSHPSGVEPGNNEDKVVAVRFGNNEDFTTEIQQIRQQIVSGLDRLMETAMAYSQQSSPKAPEVKTTPSNESVGVEASADETAGWASATTVQSADVSAPTQFPQTQGEQNVQVPQPVIPAPNQAMAAVNPEHAAGSPFSPVADTKEPQVSEADSERKFPSLRELLKLNGEDNSEASKNETARVLSPEKPAAQQSTNRKSLVPQPRTQPVATEEAPTPGHFVPGTILKQATQHQHSAPAPVAAFQAQQQPQAAVQHPATDEASPFSAVEEAPKPEQVPVATPPAPAPAQQQAPAPEPFATFPSLPENSAPNWGEHRDAS